MSTKREPDVKAKAAVLLGTGMRVAEVAEVIGVDRTTVWRWSADPNFDALRSEARKKVADQIVDAAVADFRLLVPDALEALRQGLAVTHKAQVVRLDEGAYAIVDVPDISLAVTTADKVLARVPEFAKRLDVQVGGTLVERLAELDARGDTGSD